MSKLFISIIASIFIAAACSPSIGVPSYPKVASNDDALKPQDIEDPADIAINTASSDGTMAEIEIEAVEIELEDCEVVCSD